MEEFHIPTSDEMLQKMFSKSAVKCQIGSGKCGCETTYVIASATGFNPNASTNCDPMSRDDAKVSTRVTIEEIIF
jgi:hypothetical protein